MKNLFISHSWSYPEAYEGLCRLLDDKKYSYKNYSVPKSDPIHNANNEYALEQAIKAQIERASVIIILAGVYATYSKWINIEIRLAKKLGKKIIAVQPWGAEKTSLIVKNNADRIVGWNGSSIINAIES